MRLKLYLLVVLLIAGIIPTMAQDDVVCADGEHLITHDMGQTCVADGVQRVIALEWTYAEDLLALGMQPVGIADIEGYDNWLDILVALDDDMVDVGTRQEPNLEQIIELEPDLILAASFRVAENYDELSAIAPTLAFNSYPADGASHYDQMVDTFNTIALVTGREAEAEAVLEQVQTTYTAAAEAIAASDLTNNTFILAQSYISGDAPVFRLFTDNAMAVEIMRQIGLENAWDDAPQQYGFTTVDFEGFSTIEDTLFFYIAQPEAHDAIVDAPVWGALPFVTAEHDYWLGGDVWLFGGPLSSITLVETITETLGLDVSETPQDTANLTCEEGFRPVEHAAGADCIPENLERIIVLDEGTMTDLLALDVHPIAVMDWGNRDYAQYLALDPATIESVGTPDGPNFEAMLALEPDVIIGRATDINWFGENALEHLQAIAPTILSDAVNTDWQSHLMFLGDVVDAEDRAQELVDSFETRLEEFRTAWAEQGNDATIAIIRSRADSFNIYANGYFIAETVKAAGLQMPEHFALIESGNSMSIEEIDTLSSDYLFVMVRNEDEAEAFINASEGPLWQFLPAVQNEQVYQVNWSVWVAGWNGVGAHLVIDDLFYYLLEEDSPTPNPLQSIISDEFNPEYDVQRFAQLG